jgi:hypothetical protein
VHVNDKQKPQSDNWNKIKKSKEKKKKTKQAKHAGTICRTCVSTQCKLKGTHQLDTSAVASLPMIFFLNMIPVV